MNWTITHRQFLGIFTLWLAFAGSALAQTITVNQNISPPTNLCSNSTVTLSFSVTGAFTAGNEFTLQRSNADGTFPNSPVSVGTLSSSPTSATILSITGNLGTLDYGTAYRFRVVSNAPSRTSGQTPVPVTIGTPQPGGDATFTACQNSGTFSLTASGSSLEWYTTATTNTPNGSGPTYGVGTNSPGTYFVTQTLNGCRSDKKSISLSVTSPPSTTPTVSGLRAYCPGAGGQLTASGPGTAFRWVNLTDNSVQITPTINAPSASTNYSVSQLNSAGCEGPKGTVAITVYTPPAKPELANTAVSYCQGSTAATLSVTNLGTNSVLWTFPNNRQETTNPVSATAAGQYSVVQRSSEGCFSDAATATVTISSKPNPPTLNSGGPFCQFSGTNNTQTVTATGQDVKWYADANTTTVAASGSSFTVSTAVTSPSPVVYLEQTVNGCTSTRASIPVTINATPAAPALSSVTYPTDYCASDAGSATALRLTLTSGATSAKWYNLTDNTTSTDATLAAPGATKQYQVTQSLNGCESGRSSTFAVNVKSNPGTPSLTGNTTFCQNSGTNNVQTITAAGDANATIEWFDNLTTANIRTTSNSFTVSTASADPDPVVYFQQRVNGCASTRIARTVTVNATPGKPTVSSTYAVCQNAQAETLSSAVTNGQGLRFYEGGTERAGSYRPGTGTVGTATSFLVTQTISGCEGPGETLTLTVYGLPAKPTVGSYNYCSAQAPATLSATGTNIRWYSQASAFLANGSTYPAPSATTTYRVTQTDSRNCQSDFLDVAVQVRPTPAAPGLPNPNPVFCQGRTAQALSATGDNLTWTDAAGNALSGAPTPPTNSTGQQRYFVTQTSNASCTSGTATVAVTINPVPTQPSFTAPPAYCAGTTAAALSASGASLLWYDAANGGTGSTNAPTPNTSSNPTTVTATRSYYVTQTVGSCESDRREIAVTIKRKPALPTNVPANPEFCQNTVPPTLTATPEANASIVWLVNNAYVSTAPVPQSSTVGITTYQVAQTLNDCRSDNASFTVRVKPTPVQPTVSVFTLCQGRTSRPLEAQGERLKFYDASNTLLSGTPSPSTDQVATVTYRVTQTNSEGCESAKTDYPIIVYAVPAPPAVKDLQYCLTQRDQPAQDIKPLTAEGTNLRWYFSDNNPFTTGIAPNPQPDVLRTERFFVTQTVNNCQSNQATVTVRVVTTPTPVLSTTLLTYCRNEVTRPINVSFAAGSTLTWIDPNGVTSSETPAPPTLNATKGGETYQVYALGSNGCYSARATVGLVVNTNPTLSLYGSTTVNYGQTTQLTLRFTSQPPYSFTLSDGTTGTAPDSVYRQTVKPLQTTIYQVSSVSNVCGAGLAGNPATTSVFVTIPTIATQALTSSTSLCAGTNLSVAFSTTGTFNQGNRFKVQLADSTAKAYTDISTESTTSPITATIPAAFKGGPYFIRVLATNPGAEVPGDRSPTVLTVKGLPSATLSGTQDIYETYPASLSLVLVGQSPWSISYSGSDGQTGTFNAATSPYILTVQPSKTTTYQLTSVQNECSSGPVSGTAVVNVLPLLAVENPLTGALTLFPTPTQTVLTISIELPLSIQQPAELMLSDFTGRPVLNRTTVTRQTQLDLSQQPAGLYLLNVQVGDKRAVRKVIKL